MDLDQEQKLAQQKIADTDSLISEFDDLDFKFKIQRGVELHGYLIQVAVVGATILGLVSILGKEVVDSQFAIGGIIFLAISVVAGLFYPLYSTESSIINANKAHRSIQQKNFKVLGVWTAVLHGRKKAEEAEQEHLEIAKEGVDNPWMTDVRRDPYQWAIFICFSLGILLLVFGILGSNFRDYSRKIDRHNRINHHQLNAGREHFSKFR